jgi:hypothetical protein
LSNAAKSCPFQADTYASSTGLPDWGVCVLACQLPASTTAHRQVAAAKMCFVMRTSKFSTIGTRAGGILGRSPTPTFIGKANPHYGCIIHPEPGTKSLRTCCRRRRRATGCSRGPACRRHGFRPRAFPPPPPIICAWRLPRLLSGHPGRFCGTACPSSAPLFLCRGRLLRRASFFLSSSAARLM